MPAPHRWLWWWQRVLDIRKRFKNCLTLVLTQIRLPVVPTQLFLTLYAIAPPLCQAAHYGRLDVVDVLLRGAAKPDFPDEIGTPLYYAANYGHDEIVDKLLAAGAQASKSPVALTQAVYRKNMAMVEKLLVHGTDPDAHHEEDPSALYRAVCSRRIEFVEILLANGAKPEKTPDALVEAASCGKLEMVRILLANGARPDTPDKNNRTALVQARVKGHTEIINLLESRTPLS